MRDGQLGGVSVGLSEPSLPIDSEVLFLIYSFFNIHRQIFLRQEHLKKKKKTDSWSLPIFSFLLL